MPTDHASPLLQRVAAGDGAAMREVVDRYADLLWSLARRMTGSDADAEEAVQDIIVCLWRKADKYKVEFGDEATFISVIARRRLIDRLRKSARQVPVQLLGESDPVSGTFAVPGEDADIARTAFESLTDEQKAVIRQSVLHGHTHQVISAQTGLPLGTVKTHIRRGLAEIRNRLLKRAEGSP